MNEGMNDVAGSRSRFERGGVVWLTGLSGAGKSTVSRLVETALISQGLWVEVLDGDVVRTNLSKGLGFSKEDRDTNILRIGFVADLLARNGVWVVVAAISPYRAARDEVRALVSAHGAHFFEVYVRCPLDVAESRDTKGLYRRACAGELPAFTGISDPYEEPLAPEAVIDSDKETPEESAARVLSLVERAVS